MMATRTEALSRPLGAGERVLRGHSNRFRLWPFLGPAFIACVAYIDPGNFATNIAAGSKFGYTLLWVIVAANLMAMLIQTLSAKLGIATGRNLPEVCREEFSHRATIGLWLQAEAIAMATDLAEFLGAAIGFHLLFGIDLFPAAVLTGVAAFLILGLQRFGFRPLEAVITGMVMVIGVCYLAELYYAHPPFGLAARHAVTPAFGSNEALLLSVGIIGATVMPHVIYLHSALTQNRIVPDSDEEARRLMRYTRIDVIVAMTIAGLINMAMLIMAASVFFKSGLFHVASLETAHRTLQPILGGASGTLFALALVGSGLSSSAVGTLSGQVVMQGFLRRQIPVWVRRFVTMLPAFAVIALGLDPTRTLVLSQVVLSFGIPFALIPLVVFTSRKRLMGALVNSRATVVVAALVATVIVFLNLFLLAQVFGI
jgi:manganese transport protein